MENDAIIKLGKSLEQKNELKKEIGELKQEKAKLDREITILDKAKETAKEEFNVEKANLEIGITSLKNTLKTLETQRANLATNVAPEIKRLNVLKGETEKKLNELRKTNEAHNLQVERFSKNQKQLAGKIEILGEIVELSKGL